MNREEFESLNPEEQAKVFQSSPFKEKGELILNAHQPDFLAQSLSHEELYLVTREMDLEERAEIIRFASLPQLVFISDIDCWLKDRISPEGFLHWLETLERADEKRLLAWLMLMDYEAVIAGFKSIIRVLKPEWEYAADELLGDQPYFTLDNLYYIAVEEENLETVRRAFEILFENHRGRYTAILEGILSEVDDMVEEDAFRNREMRLSDRGFPDEESARRIYKPISRQEFDSFEHKKITSGGETQTPKIAPNYPLLWSQERFYLDDVLLRLKEESPELMEHIGEEMAWLSNKVIATEGIDFTSEERVRQGVERARRILSIGLESLSRGDVNRACELLKERWLETIFRWGMSCLVELRDQAEMVIQVYWKGSKEAFLEFLNPPYQYIFRGLLQLVPENYDPEVQGRVYPLRDFKVLDELQRAQISLMQIERISRWVQEISNKQFLMEGIEKNAEGHDSTFFSWLGNCFANFVLEKGLSFEPLNETDIRTLVSQAFSKKGEGHYLSMAVKEKFLNRSFNPEDQALLTSLWGFVFQEIEEELGKIEANETVDLRFISCLKVISGSSPKFKPHK